MGEILGEVQHHHCRRQIVLARIKPRADSKDALGLRPTERWTTVIRTDDEIGS